MMHFFAFYRIKDGIFYYIHFAQNDMKTMRDGMAVLGTVAHNTVISLRNDLSALRSWVYSHQAEIIAIVQKLYTESQQQQCHIQNLLQVSSRSIFPPYIKFQ